VSRAAGWLADHSWSRPVGKAVVGVYSRAYGVTFEDCVEQDGWTSFDHFFTRALRDGVRPIDADPRAIVSPADGRVESMGVVDERSTFLVKGRSYRVEELVGDADEAKRYVGGGGCVVYLSPRDYHRVHAPCDGTIARVRSMPGDYYPVNAIGIEHVPNLFARNRRVAIAIDTPKSSGLGRVTAVMVAAIVVGRITVTGVDERDVPIGDHAPKLQVARGDEIGMFHLGSTVVLFFERAAMGEWVAREGAVRYGEAIARAPRTRGAAR
jgi:phosphatidylserine decarboxylase